MAAGDLDAAAAKLNAAPEGWRKNFQLRMLEAELRERQEAPDRAIELYKQVQADFPNRPAPAVKLVRLLLKADRPAEACDLFDSAVWPGPAAPEVKTGLLAGLAPRADAKRAEVYLDRLPPQVLREPELAARVAAMEAREGLVEKALARLNDAVGPLPAAGEILRVDLLVRRFDFAEALEHARRAAAENPDRIELTRKLLVLLELTRQPEEAHELLKEAFKRWPDDPALMTRLNNLPIPTKPFAELFAVVRAARDKGGFSPQAQFQFALAALQAEDIPAAREALELIPDDGSVDPSLAPLKAVLDSRPHAEWVERSRLDDDLVNQLQVVRTPGARATLAVFTGVRNRCCQLSLAQTDVLFADHPVNVIYMRAGARGYIVGIPGLGTDPESSARGLRDLADSLGPQPLVTMGFSAGGLAATRFASKTGARAAVSFSGPTAVYSYEDKPPEAAMTFVRREAAMLSTRERDVRPDIVEHPEMQVYHLYGAENPEDTRQARRLEGLPNVELIGLEGAAGHATALDALVQGEFDRVLRKILKDIG